MGELVKLIDEHIEELENLNRIKEIVAPQSIKKVIDNNIGLLKKLKGYFKR